MIVILCHTTADFDTLGAAVGLTRLHSGARVVLTGGAHPPVRDFLALYRDEYALIELRAVNPKQISSVVVVDTQQRARVGKASEWLDKPDLDSIYVYDHHPNGQMDILATHTQIEPVGATTTLIVEQLQSRQIKLTPIEATVMALGIHADTGSLTFDNTTPRDASALAWLMVQGANVRVIADYLDRGLSPQLQQLLTAALENLKRETVQGYKVSWVLLKTDGYVSGLSGIASKLMEITSCDALLLAVDPRLSETGDEKSHSSEKQPSSKLTVVGRSQIPGTNLNELFKPLGGGGHSSAAFVTLSCHNPSETLNQLIEQLKATIPQQMLARELMSSPVRTIRPETTIGEAQRILLRYGHSGLSVVNAQARLVGIISRRDIDLALHHGFSHAPVKGYMTTNLKTITPDTLLPEIECMMVTYDIGRLPVLSDGLLVGIVTRTDVLRQLYQQKNESRSQAVDETIPTSLNFEYTTLSDRFSPQLWEVLSVAAELAFIKGWHLYIVGGAVRDLLRKDLGVRDSATRQLSDIDLVVDGFHHSEEKVGAGVELASALQKIYPETTLEVHGKFQTAALLWHSHPVLDSLLIDIATARTEFYPYPAANPEVEASSIRQDLYRRDFTINALAVRLTPPRAGELLDFFGGLLDLQKRQIRVLHANSFIEDPTRIYRAVRFAVRLGFQIEPQTQGYIRYCVESGIYDLAVIENNFAPALQTRLKTELKYILQADYWTPALQLLASLGALKCLHPTLELDAKLWWQVRYADRWLRRLDPQNTLIHWQMRLEVLIAYLATEYRAKVAANLHLPADSIERLRQLAIAQETVNQQLPTYQLKSEVATLCRQYKLPSLILIAVQSSRAIRRQIWQYLTIYSNIQPPLNGNDLRAAGYKPGPPYRQILDALLAATIDGIVSDRVDAETFLAEHYPLLLPEDDR